MIDKITIEYKRNNDWKRISSSDNRLEVVKVARKHWEIFCENHKFMVVEPSIYIIMGENEEGINYYVGEANKLNERLNNNHNQFNANWAQEVFFIKSKDNQDKLNKNELPFLESMLIKKLRMISKDNVVHNKNENNNIPVNSIQKDKLNNELIRIYDFVSKLDSDMFIEKQERTILREEKEILETEDNVEVYIKSSHGSIGKGIFFLQTKKLLVLEDSFAAKHTTPNTYNKESRLQKLNKIRNNKEIVSETKEGYIFLKDYIFKTPSGAANIFWGGEVNGWIEWKVSKTNESIKKYVENHTQKSKL